MVRVERTEPIGSSKSVHIYAARNEWEPFQIVVSARGGDLSNVNISMSDLVKVDEPSVSIPADQFIYLYKEHYVRVAVSSPFSPYLPDWVPDALIPFKDPYSGTELSGPVYDAVPFNLSDGENQPIWVDVLIPKWAPPGNYTAEVIVTADGGQTTSIPVKLTVWSFTLPDRPTQRSAFGLSPQLLASAYGLDIWEDAEIFFPLIRRYYEALITHHIMPDLPEDTCPQLDERTGEVNFDAAFYPGLGTAAQNLEYYMNELKMNAYQLPIWEDWPYSQPLTEQRELAKSYIANYVEYFTNHGWAGRLYAYLIDEPNDAEAYQRVREWGILFDEVERDYGIHMDFLVTEQPVPDDQAWGSLVGTVDIWVPLACTVWLDEDYYGTHTISGRLEAGEEVWCYTALVQPSEEWWMLHNWPDTLTEDYPPVWLLDYPQINYRILSWLNQHYGLTGLLYWETVFWEQTADVWSDPGTYHEGGETFNGEGSLLYPGRMSEVGFDGPIASMRLKWIREGFEDYEYIRMLRELNPLQADNLLHQVVRNIGDWEISPSVLCDVRITMGELLDELYLPISEISNWGNDLSQVAVVVGASHPHGPISRGSLSDDVVGAASLSGALGTLNCFLDVEVADYIEEDGEVDWNNLGCSYKKVVAVGGPFVNLIPYKFKDRLAFPVKAFTENGHRLSTIEVEKDGILRVYINQTDSEVIIEYENGTRRVIGKVESADFMIAEMVYDHASGKEVALFFGTTKWGSVAVCRWVSANLNSIGDYFGDSRAALMAWKDDGDGFPEAEEVEVLTTFP